MHTHTHTQPQTSVKLSLTVYRPIVPGNPDGNTLDGYGSMMEVGYVAHYVGI